HLDQTANFCASITILYSLKTTTPSFSRAACISFEAACVFFFESRTILCFHVKANKHIDYLYTDTNCNLKSHRCGTLTSNWHFNPCVLPCVSVPRPNIPGYVNF
ncbi:unnamed protein product, partial [Staurois parvus]